MTEVLKLLESNLFLLLILGLLFVGGARLLVQELIALVKLCKKLKATLKSRTKTIKTAHRKRLTSGSKPVLPHRRTSGIHSRRV